MKLSEQERSARKSAFHQMSSTQKADYIITYYKFPILLGLIAIIILCSTVYRQLSKKEILLYTAYINVAIGDDLDDVLTSEFVGAADRDRRRNEVYAYRGLYLSDDASLANHEYAYASRLKLLGAINAKQLDIVLMNREAYGIFSQSGYLLELSPLTLDDTELRQKLEPYLSENAVIIEDNAIEYNLNEADTYQAVIEEVQNAVEVSSLPVFQAAGFSDSVYLGVIANSPRLATDLLFLEYLVTAE